MTVRTDPYLALVRPSPRAPQGARNASPRIPPGFTSGST